MPLDRDIHGRDSNDRLSQNLARYTGWITTSIQDLAKIIDQYSEITKTSTKTTTNWNKILVFCTAVQALSAIALIFLTIYQIYR